MHINGSQGPWMIIVETGCKDPHKFSRQFERKLNSAQLKPGWNENYQIMLDVSGNGWQQDYNMPNFHRLLSRCLKYYGVDGMLFLSDQWHYFHVDDFFDKLARDQNSLHPECPATLSGAVQVNDQNPNRDLKVIQKRKQHNKCRTFNDPKKCPSLVDNVLFTCEARQEMDLKYRECYNKWWMKCGWGLPILESYSFQISIDDICNTPNHPWLEFLTHLFGPICEIDINMNDDILNLVLTNMFAKGVNPFELAEHENIENLRRRRGRGARKTITGMSRRTLTPNEVGKLRGDIGPQAGSAGPGNADEPGGCRNRRVHFTRPRVGYYRAGCIPAVF